MEYETIRFETSDDHVATLTLDRADLESRPVTAHGGSRS